jgi:hypothetical protein
MDHISSRQDMPHLASKSNSSWDSSRLSLRRRERRRIMHLLPSREEQVTQDCREMGELKAQAPRGR